jgi:formylglycine-generating enzyme required for sulfatase activity
VIKNKTFFAKMRRSALMFLITIIIVNCCLPNMGLAIVNNGIMATYAPVGDSLPPGKTLQQVLFATNEDCNLSIAGEFNGTVTKTEHLQLQLAPGNYTYKAASKISAGELEESFTVKDAGLNEIFIDLLYVSDQNQQAETQKKKTEKPVVNRGRGKEISQETNIKPANEPAAVVSVILENMGTINGGSFIMGNNKAPSKDEAEHTVSINSILFSKYEVTQGQWQVIMGNNPSVNKGCSTCPVENVSWEEVMKFIKKLNVLGNKKFRLPTEAEWEYVARYGGKEEIDKAGGPEEFIKASAWYFANSDKKTHPVGQKQANAAGIFDLFGNVSEWCSDWYSPDYFMSEPQKNPAGPPLGKEKIVRGGSYNEYSGDRFRPSLRNKLNPTSKDKSIGFRLVMDVP